MTKKATMKAFKDTTFTDLFNLPKEPDPQRINPHDDEEFNENIVAICKGVLYDIMMDPTEKAYTKIEAARELLNRSLGKPLARNENKNLDVEELQAALPRIVQRPDETDE